MRVLITGGLGFIGTQVAALLLKRGHEITIVDQAPRPTPETPSPVRYISADTILRGPWQKEVALHEIVINLAGASIFRRWNKESRKLIHDSRVLTARNVAEAIPKESGITLFSASAVGYYGFRGDEELSETSPPGKDFLARLCIDWEQEARKAEERSARVITTRFGIVLDKGGGALEQMISAFKKHAGGPLGSGKQWFSWIHMTDLLNAILFLMDHPDIRGPVNCCSPNPVRNREMAQALGKVLHRPSSIPAPAFMLRMALGEFASVLLEGQRVIPTVLLNHGFRFEHPEIAQALEDIVGQS